MTAKPTCTNCDRTTGNLIWHDGYFYCPGACVITKKHPGNLGFFRDNNLYRMKMK